MISFDRTLFLVLLALTLDPVHAAGDDAPLATAPESRRLSDFSNDDGSVPDGKDGTRDDTTALRKALAAGPGIVQIGPGSYRFGEIAVPPQVTLVGSGTATVIRSSGPKQVFLQKDASHWAIRDLVVDGEAPDGWKTRTDGGQSGIAIEGCWGYEVTGVTLRNFNGAALQITRTNLREAGFAQGGTLDRVSCCDNWVGVRFDVRAEYIHATKLSCMRNHIGCVVHAGNVKISDSNFGMNIDGVYLEDKTNGSHGTLANCLCNHNERYALWARGVDNGMIVNGCCFFYGTMLIERSSGVNVTSGIISCHLKTTDEGANRIAGNLITPLNWTFSFSTATIVRDNFVKEGQWDQNRP